MSPMFSIIMTSYNYGEYIGAAIESVISQSFVDWELIIVDDCSSDNSWDVILKYTDSRIKAIRFESNQGAFYAYQKGFYESKGKFIASLDSDDMFAPSKLYDQFMILETNPDIDICGTWVSVINSSGEKFSSGDCSIENWFNNNFDLNSPQSWIWQNRLCHSSSVISKPLHEQLLKSEKNYRYTPDWDMWIRALALGAKFFVIQKPLTIMRQHERNITHANPLLTAEEYSLISAITLNNFLISNRRLDLLKENINGFLKHPLIKNSDKTRIIAQALGYQFSEAGSDVGIKKNPILIGLSYFIEEYGNISSERDTAIAERDSLIVKINLIYNSISWKLTLPLRLFKKYVLNLK